MNTQLKLASLLRRTCAAVLMIVTIPLCMSASTVTQSGNAVESDNLFHGIFLGMNRAEVDSVAKSLKWTRSGQNDTDVEYGSGDIGFATKHTVRFANDGVVGIVSVFTDDMTMPTITEMFFSKLASDAIATADSSSTSEGVTTVYRTSVDLRKIIMRFVRTAPGVLTVYSALR